MVRPWEHHVMAIMAPRLAEILIMAWRRWRSGIELSADPGWCGSVVERIWVLDEGIKVRKVVSSQVKGVGGGWVSKNELLFFIQALFYYLEMMMMIPLDFSAPKSLLNIRTEYCTLSVYWKQSDRKHIRRVSQGSDGFSGCPHICKTH